MVLVQKWPFFNPFFLGNIGKENVFYDILAQKNAFLGYKNKKLKKSKNWHFSKGVKPWFWSKHGHFLHLFFSGNIGKESVFYDLLEGKNVFLGYKDKNLKQSKSFFFLKGLIHGFCPKMAIFLNSFFRQYRLGKCLLRYSRTRKRLSGL